MGSWDLHGQTTKPTIWGCWKHAKVLVRCYVVTSELELPGKFQIWWSDGWITLLITLLPECSMFGIWLDNLYGKMWVNRCKHSKYMQHLGLQTANQHVKIFAFWIAIPWIYGPTCRLTAQHSAVKKYVETGETVGQKWPSIHRFQKSGGDGQRNWLVVFHQPIWKICVSQIGSWNPR